ncbi:MAG TPA: M56 family metallopeptidase [Pyrinomonadaceae bacterium]|nr:M56 family metallopeptidase [Pyrinomonadaceae bacterium]
MKISSQLLLTFLLNAVWQIALIAALAAVGSWLLRKSVARYQHWVWIGGLCLAFLVPVITSSRVLFESHVEPPPAADATFLRQPAVPFANELQPSLSTQTHAAQPSSAFQLNQTIALTLLAIYCGFLLYRIFKLVQAWHTTRTICRHSVELNADDRLTEIIQRCERNLEISPQSVKLLSSETLPVPVTIGLRHPVIILPEPLLREGNIDLLTSAIGHEFIHVARRDYLLNLVYELLFVPISFHPAAALLRRRVKQTRELCCDELVAERILNAEVYARSLVRLASSAPPLRRLSVTTTVGIADADILEARIMSLLKKPELNTRWKKPLLFAVLLLLLVPCVVATAFAMRFDVAPNTQDPAAQEKQETKERKEKEKLEMKVRQGRESEEMKERMESDPEVRHEIARREQLEMEMRSVRQAALVRLAKINMDQAIQIATSQQPGKVLECSLNASHWKEPGKLADDGYVFYHVVIADESSEGATHVLVNANDGSIIKTEKELPRKRSSEGQ